MNPTHCCICRRRLEDFASKEQGFGRTCGERYLSAQGTPDVEAAVGLIVAADWPLEQIHALVASRNDVTALTQAVTYWASCNYEDKNAVIACAKVLYACGRTHLATKLVADRVRVHVTCHKVTVMVHTTGGHSNEFAIDAKRLPSSDRTMASNGQTRYWVFDLVRKDQVLVLLGHWFPDEPFLMQEEGLSDLRVLPRTPRVDVEQILDPGFVGKQVGLEDAGGTYVVLRNTFHGTFTKELKATIPDDKRRWDVARKAWHIDRGFLPAVKNLVLRHFGVVL